MATNGDRHIDYSYPDLDTWRRGEKGFVHNTSGATLSQLSKKHRMQEPHASDQGTGPSSAAAGPSGYTYGYGVEEDVPYYSQPGSAFGDDYPPANASSREEEDEYDDEEGGDDDEGTEAEDNGHDEDAETAVPAGEKRVTVEIKKHSSSSGYYFVDSKRKKRETKKKQWKLVQDGYELRGRSTPTSPRAFHEQRAGCLEDLSIV
ncbi:hypothetical protein PT974_07960 [Cladobotryum mycophilum]|uniref:Uncharacterized protein n=1 Tax=Cladobotryum mycophilum TaxID=491253 RepID=A0ABR0SCL0_9HYPO